MVSLAFVTITHILPTACRYWFIASLAMVMACQDSAKQYHDNWTTGNSVDFGLPADTFASLDRNIDSGAYGNLHSLLVVLDGKLIYERYVPGYEYGLDPTQDHGQYIHYNANHLHDIASITKAIVSLSTGIALDKGFLQSLNQKVASFFPEYKLPADSPWWKTSLTNLLTMTAGFTWIQAGDGSDTDRLFEVADPVRYIFERPFNSDPGKVFLYNQGCPTLMAEILRRATGMRLDDFARKWLFAPLGIEAAEWKVLPQGVVYAGGDLRMRPRDLATLGLLIQKGGRLGESQVVSEAYVREATTGRYDGGPGMYGYFWWAIQSNSKPVSCAMGRGGQGIFLYPGSRLMMVCTGGSWNKEETGNEPFYPYDILRQEMNPLFDQLSARLDGMSPVNRFSFTAEAPCL